MFKVSTTVPLATAFLAVTVAAPAVAQQIGNYAMATGGETTQPFGHYEFCRNNWAECGHTEVSTPLAINDAVWAQLDAINRQVNASVAAFTDYQIYGQEEYWAYPTSVGDCEDYVLLKRRLLSEAGIPLSNLLVTMVFLPDGQGHAVLTVRTDSGDFVLDNLRNDVRLWTETGYRFVKRQSIRNAGAWVSINNGAVAMAPPPLPGPAAAPTTTGTGPIGPINRPG